MVNEGVSGGGRAGGAGPSDDPAALFRAANAALRAGDYAAAAADYRKLLRLDPRSPVLHNNLGIALKGDGRLEEAEGAYRQALALAPDYAPGHANLAGMLAGLGRAEASLRAYQEAIRLEPAKAAHRQGFAAALRSLRFTEAGPALIDSVAACLADPGIEHQPMMPAVLSMVRLTPAVRSALALAETADDGALGAWLLGPESAGLLEHPLLLPLLRQTVLADPGFERLLTRLRDLCITAVPDGPLAIAIERRPAFFVALACHCWINGFAYAPPPNGDSLHGDPTAERPSTLLASALSGPLTARPDAQALMARLTDLPPAYAPLFDLQLARPLREARLEADLPRLTPIDDPTSQAVRAQYEDHPYPRWLTSRAIQSRPLSAVLKELFPYRRDLPDPPSPLRILVAGCGTGKHAIDVAGRYADAEVLAIDLSRRSLAYAARQAKDCGLDSLRFAQADLLRIGCLDKRFDLIEAMGVLHHLREPRDGWRALLACLAPGGLLRVGLYSRAARRHLVAARAWIAERGFTTDDAGLRAARQALLALPAEHPAYAATSELDFYSLSGCRDLLCHEQEGDYDLAEVAGLLVEFGLEFLGFEFVDPAVPRAYRARFPHDEALTDLDNWAAFEADAPATFRTLYQFWCRRP